MYNNSSGKSQISSCLFGCSEAQELFLACLQFPYRINAVILFLDNGNRLVSGFAFHLTYLQRIPKLSEVIKHPFQPHKKAI